MEQVQPLDPARPALRRRIIRHAALLWREAGSQPGTLKNFIGAAERAELALRQPAELGTRDPAADPASFAGF